MRNRTAKRCFEKAGSEVWGGAMLRKDKLKGNAMKTRNVLLLILVLLAAFFVFGHIRDVNQSSLEISELTETEEDPALTEARERMISEDLRKRDIIDEQVLEVMGKVQRHKFVAKSLWNQAYADHPLPIGEGQTISQPYIVALMTQSLQLRGDEKVLEIGTGSGYQAAVLAEIVDEVYTVEIIEPLAKKAEKAIGSLHYTNIKVKNADGYFGWEEYAPFDAVIVTCAANHIPPLLIDQLKDGGRLIIPLGSTRHYQTLTLVKKKGESLETNYVTGVVFVPMTGEAMK